MGSLVQEMKNLIIILQVLCLGPNKEKETLINIRRILVS